MQVTSFEDWAAGIQLRTTMNPITHEYVALSGSDILQETTNADDLARYLHERYTLSIMSQLGFSVEETGGGFKACIRRCSNESVQVTDLDGNLPLYNEPVIVAFYEWGGLEMLYLRFQTLESFITSLTLP